ncbi:MAG TPA: RNA polymerase sigma factor [Gemmatimonadales bacterium]|nr:RNA polymerase sigma factor [Gemmatimonadales bacterium]
MSRPPTPDRSAGPGLSEAADVALAASGDQRAFERLYRQHVARIHSLARRMVGGDGDPDELTQDVFVRAWERLGTYRGEAAFGTWLHRLAVNAILNWRRSEASGRRYTDDRVDLESVQGGRAGRGGEALDLESAIAKLPRGAREVFVLHDVQGFRHEEIAAMTGVTTGTSKAQLHRARMLLRAHLER